MLTRMDHTLAQRFARLGVAVPEILLPSDDVDLEKWAVIACDQHTSEPDYWKEVDTLVGDAPSTLRLIYPEVYLGSEPPEPRIAAIREAMAAYLSGGVLQPARAGLILTARTTSTGRTRTGLIVALDLEAYDYRPGARSLIRASEETIVERLPPRIRIREGAPIELPHVLVLIDDRDAPVIAPLTDTALSAYRTRLMLGGGRVSGSWVGDGELAPLADRLEQILSASPADNRFLFAVGDGNHSLATAKAVWDKLKPTVAGDHPARYALVELVSLYDPGLHVEPIHRIVRTADPSGWARGMIESIGGEFAPAESPAELRAAVARDGRAVGIATSAERGILRLADDGSLPVAVVQEYLNRDPALKIDYIHGFETTLEQARDDSVVAIVLPDFDPGMLFPTIAADGVLPRKAFSLGEAADKRYYLEARRISD